MPDTHPARSEAGDAYPQQQTLSGICIPDTPPPGDVHRPSGDTALLHFSVRDTGVGIPPEKRERIFDSFSQADASTTREYGGTGLGLAIASQLIEMMGGRLWLDSEVGKGSTFHFTARFGVRQTEQQAREAPRHSLAGVRALAVDDNETNRLILRETLEGWGMAVTLAEDGAAALAAMEEATRAGRPFDIVYTDFHMPHMDGAELTNRLRANADWSEVKVIMLSSSAGFTGERSQKIRIDACLAKPVRQSELLDATLNVLGVTRAPAASSDAEDATEARPERLRILLAEDNEVNQELVLAILEKEAHTVVVANNGREAVEASEREAFDVVLMDVRMPEMDGMQATAAIRQREETTGEHLPIIALTAHAMEGDRDQCLAAGMDGYATKPIRPADLLAEIERVVGSETSASAEPQAEATVAETGEPFNLEDALAPVGGDEALLKRVMGVFLDKGPAMLERVREAVASGDALAIRDSAHALKGAARNLGAGLVGDLAHQLEQGGESGDLTEAPALFDELEREFERLVEAVEEFTK